MIDNDLSSYLATPDKLGKAKRIDDARGRYMWSVKNTFSKDKTLDGLKIVVDCANGSAYSMAPTILWELGAEVIAIGDNPDGFNINQNCGSTSPQVLCKAVVEHKGNIGIALDGDADRLVIVDEKGEVVHGDKIIGLIAEKLHDEGKLKQDTVVATQMSNLALEEYLRYFGVSLIRTNVGDRYVLEEMKKGGYNFGGEQSGHIVLGDYSTTGDGLVAALQILEILCSTKKPISEIVNIFKLYPQILKNVKYQNGANPLDKADVQSAIKSAQEKLGNEGRILVRKSGTENLIRIMAEGKDAGVIQEVVDGLAKTMNHE